MFRDILWWLWSLPQAVRCGESRPHLWQKAVAAGAANPPTGGRNRILQSCPGHSGGAPGLTITSLHFGKDCFCCADCSGRVDWRDAKRGAYLLKGGEAERVTELGRPRMGMWWAVGGQGRQRFCEVQDQFTAGYARRHIETALIILCEDRTDAAGTTSSLWMTSQKSRVGL